MDICVVAGARPNFIKVAPILRAVENAQREGQNVSCKLIYSGRKDDPTLEKNLFDDLQMKRPDEYLGVDCTDLNELTGQVMSSFGRYLQVHNTDAVIVVDDLASTMAAAIVTKKRGLMLAHLVAGTRSFDINMPKEINRLVIDGLSDLLFTAGIGSSSAATKEGAEQSKVYMVGNILMDTLRYNHSRMSRPRLFDDMKLREREYILFTLNRRALISKRAELDLLVNTMIDNAAGKPIVAPLREYAAAAVSDILVHRKDGGGTLHIIEPQSYLDFGYLSANARGIVTDSGNVAEEATFNSVPCVTLNRYTEHIETVKIGSNVLVGEDAELLATQMQRIINGNWKHCAVPERWDGRSAERIVQILLERGRQMARQ